MGFFSWITSDTNKSIPSSSSNREPLEVYMITRGGLEYKESSYGGYGMFGGKDFYGLIDELNGGDGTDRNRGIQLYYGSSAVTNGEITYVGSGQDFFNWQNELIHEGKSANDLLADGWKSITVREIEEKDLVLPKFVETLPSRDNWIEEFDALKRVKDCPDQGHFYEN